MTDEDPSARLRDRLARQGEDAIGKLAQELLENPLVTGAIARAFDARERAVRAQETAMSALNLPSAADSSGSPAGCARSPSAWRGSRTASTASTAA